MKIFTVGKISKNFTDRLNVKQKNGACCYSKTEDAVTDFLVSLSIKFTVIGLSKNFAHK